MATTITDIKDTFNELRTSVEEAADKVSELDYDLDELDEDMSELIEAAVELVESADSTGCTDDLVVVSAKALKVLRDLLVDFNEISPESLGIPDKSISAAADPL